MRIGIDLGGTKIEGIALDDAGQELYRKRIDAPQGSYHKTLHALTQLIAEIESNTQMSGSVGIGIGDSFSKLSEWL